MNTYTSDPSITEKVKKIVSDPQNLMFELQKKKKDVLMWIAFIILSILIYLFLSGGNFSFIYILSALTQTFSLFIIVYKVYFYQNTSGISLNSMICYLILISSRLTSTLFYYGYLPADSSGDWFYQLCEITSVVLVIIIIFFIKNLFRETAETENEDQIHYSYLVIPTFILALLVHTSLNRNFFTDIAWSFSMYLEAVSIYPQLYLFQKKGGVIESHTSHYVSLQGLSRFLSLIFWWFTYDELNNEMDDSFSIFHSYTGYFIIGSQILQIIIMIDFYYFYFKSLLKGEKMNISSEI